jgi:hypothetical protein
MICNIAATGPGRLPRHATPVLADIDKELCHV